MLTSAPIGTILTRESPVLTQESFNEFGALLGTDAPIHVDPGYARQTAFGNTIAQGMLLLAPLESWLCELWGEAAWFSRGRIHARLLNTAVAGERATMQLTVTACAGASITGLDFSLLCGERTLAAGKVSLND
jgi:acyl dehydratase